MIGKKEWEFSSKIKDFFKESSITISRQKVWKSIHQEYTKANLSMRKETDTVNSNGSMESITSENGKTGNDMEAECGQIPREIVTTASG